MCPCVAQESQTVEERFREAENTFRFQDYEKAEKLLYNLLHPEVLLTDPDQIIKAREYLGACYYWLGDEKRMEEEFTALLILSPRHTLDPFYYPADLIERLENLRSRLAELRVISLEEPKPTEEKKKDECRMEKETVVRKSRVAAFIPFGVGQFYNGDKVKGALILSGEVLALGTNVGAFIAIERLRGADGLYSKEDARQARRLRIVQYASLGAFLGLVVLGIVDGALNFVGEERSVEVVPCPEPQGSLGVNLDGKGGDSTSLCFRFIR